MPNNIIDTTRLPHIGQMIQGELRRQGRTVTWFAGQLCCQRPNVYDIFRRTNIDLMLLVRISNILSHNFLEEINRRITANYPPP